MSDTSLHRFFQIDECDMGWGDYGAALAHGYAVVAGLREARLSSSGQANVTFVDLLSSPALVDRTGPYVPPVTIPSPNSWGVILLNSRAKEKFNLRFPEIELVAAVKRTIVYSDWESWPRGPDPLQFPETGEPEDYIYGDNCKRLTDSEMESLWRPVLSVEPAVEYISGRKFDEMQFRIDREAWLGAKMFVSKNEYDFSPVFVVDEMRKFFEDELNAGEFLQLRELEYL